MLCNFLFYINASLGTSLRDFSVEAISHLSLFWDCFVPRNDAPNEHSIILIN